MRIVVSYGTLKSVTLAHGWIVDILGFVSCMISVKSTKAT